MIALAWVLLGLAALNVVVTVHVLVYGRFPSWTPFVGGDRFGPVSAWGNMLVSAYLALSVIDMSVDPPRQLAYALPTGTYLCLAGAVVLWLEACSQEAGDLRTVVDAQLVVDRL
ncbi:hypothetical protein ACIBEJ_39535 [Nonomuraea sp. NPDC050790]|uniref:hypothetical protein n=1 Tax=Nonomuraea sp. NPDC050790 TaxID=3364371 RepID=UPI00379A693E